MPATLTPEEIKALMGAIRRPGLDRGRADGSLRVEQLVLRRLLLILTDAMTQAWVVNGRLIARGEAVVVNDKFGVRITDIVSPQERIQRLR